VPLYGDTIAIAGGGAVGIELTVHFPGHGLPAQPAERPAVCCSQQKAEVRVKGLRIMLQAHW
jgi:hypothetical protein